MVRHFITIILIISQKQSPNLSNICFLSLRKLRDLFGLKLIGKKRNNCIYFDRLWVTPSEI